MMNVSCMNQKYDRYFELFDELQENNYILHIQLHLRHLQIVIKFECEIRTQFTDII